MKNEIEALDALMDVMTEEEQRIALDNKLPYLFSKAFACLKIGAAECRKKDYFKLPAMDLDKDEMDAIQSGCEQILQGIGYCKEKPFTGIHIRGFNLLFDLMHFEAISHKSTSTKIDDKTCYLDEIKLKHVMDGSEITYYNLVQY